MTKEEFIEALRNFDVLVNNEREIDIYYLTSDFNYKAWKIKPKSVTVNGVEVPEPLRIVPKNNDIFYTINSYGVNTDHWAGTVADKERFKNGAIHLTREAAQAHYDALWLPTRSK